MKVVKTIVLSALTLFFVLMCIGCGSMLARLFFAIALVLVLPVERIQSSFPAFIRSPILKVVLVIAFFLVGCILIPSSVREAESESTPLPTVEPKTLPATIEPTPTAIPTIVPAPTPTATATPTATPAQTASPTPAAISSTTGNSNGGKFYNSATGTWETIPVPTKRPAIEYDALQTIFLTITSDTTVDEIKNIVTQPNVYVTEKEYSGDHSICYKVAFAEDVASQYRPAEGDYVQVTFSSKSDGKLKFAEYYNRKAFEGEDFCTAILYESGTYWDFRDTGMDGDYKGYYGKKYDFKESSGIVIKYTNGNEAETDYYAFDSAEAIVNRIVDNANK